MKKFFKNFYLLLIFLFLYAPIVVLMIFSFNDSKSRRLWNGFTTRWYVELFRDADILHSLYVTLLVAVIAAAIATFLGTIAAIGIHNMGRRAKAAYLTVNNIPMSSSDTIIGVTFMLLFAAIGTGTPPLPAVPFLAARASCRIQARSLCPCKIFLLAIS